MFNLFKPFDIFKIGYSGNTYNPFINYTWQMLPNAKVKNSGTSGVDLQLYSGNPLDFQATQGIQVNKSFTLSGNAISLYLGFDTDSIAITHTLAEFDNLKVSIVNAVLRVTINAVNHDVAILVVNTYYQTEIVINSNNLIVKVNGTQTYSASCTALNTTILKSVGANDGLASGRFDGQFDYFIVYNGLTTFSLANQFFKDMSTDVNTLFCTDFGGNSGYVADDMNVSETLLNINGDLSDGTTSGFVGHQGCILTNIENTLVVTPNTWVWNGCRILCNINVGDIIHVKFEIFDTVARDYYAQQNSAYLVVGRSIANSFTTIEFVYQATVSKADTTIYKTEAYEFKVDNVQINKISNIYPITNYSATQRTNFTQVNKGLQDLTRLFDSNGFFLDNTDYLNCNGKGKATVIEPSRTSKVTIQTNPTILSGNILSGGVTLTTAGLTAGIDNDIVLDNQAISSNIDIGVEYKGKVTIYKEDLL